MHKLKYILFIFIKNISLFKYLNFNLFIILILNTELKIKKIY